MVIVKLVEPKKEVNIEYLHTLIRYLKYNKDGDIRADFCGIGGNGVKHTDLEKTFDMMIWLKRFFNRTSSMSAAHYVVSYDRKTCDSLEEALVKSELVMGFFKLKHLQTIYAIHEANHEDGKFHVHYVINPVSYKDGKVFGYRYNDLVEFVNYVAKALCLYKGEIIGSLKQTTRNRIYSHAKVIDLNE